MKHIWTDKFEKSLQVETHTCTNTHTHTHTHTRTHIHTQENRKQIFVSNRFFGVLLWSSHQGVSWRGLALRCLQGPYNRWASRHLLTAVHRRSAFGRQVRCQFSLWSAPSLGQWLQSIFTCIHARELNQVCTCIFSTFLHAAKWRYYARTPLIATTRMHTRTYIHAWTNWKLTAGFWIEIA